MFKSRKLAALTAFLIISLFSPFYAQAASDNVSYNQEAFAKWFAQATGEYEKTLGIQLKDSQPGKITLAMAVTPEKHINNMGIVHGGAIMSLADTAMWAACVNQGSLTVTVDFNINFIRKIQPEGTVVAVGYVLHHGRQTMVAEAEIYDKDNRFAAKARGTFFVTGKADTNLP